MNIILILTIITTTTVFTNDKYVGIIFEDEDGSEYVSHSLTNWNMIEGTGNWSVFQEGKREAPPFVLVDEYGNNEQIIADQKDEENYKKSELLYRDAIHDSYNLILSRESSQDALILEYTQSKEQTITFQIVNLNGTIIYETDPTNFGPGTSNYFIDISNLNSGAYFVRTVGGEISLSVKFIKEN